jgi:hypothetical protein
VASDENAKILLLDPDYIPARMARVLESIEGRRFGEAQSELSIVLNRLDLIEYLRKDPSLLRCLHQISHKLLINGKAREAQILARQTLDLANALRQLRSESHYNLAQAYAVLARDDRAYVPQAANELWHVFVANPSNRARYLQDLSFDAVREQIDSALEGKPDPTSEHDRLVSAPLARTH